MIVQAAVALAADLLHVLLDVLVDALDQRMGQTLRDTCLAPGQVLAALLRPELFHRLGIGDQSLSGLRMPVPQHIFHALAAARAGSVRRPPVDPR